jgi:zinc-ribbon domain
LFCASCGKQLSNDAKFCSSCGAPVEAAIRSMQSQTPHRSAEPVLRKFRGFFGFGIGLTVLGLLFGIIGLIGKGPQFGTVFDLGIAVFGLGLFLACLSQLY